MTQSIPSEKKTNTVLEKPFHTDIRQDREEKTIKTFISCRRLKQRCDLIILW